MSKKKNPETEASTEGVASSESRLVVGSPEPGLSFEAPVLEDPPIAAVGDQLEVGAPLVTSVANATGIVADSARAAASSFGEAIVAGRVGDAFALLTETEQKRIGSAQKFEEILSRESPWLSSVVTTLKSEPESEPEIADGAFANLVALRVTQTPSIDEIRGVVAPSAIVKLPTREDLGGWKVSWERRTVSQEFAALESRLSSDVLAWANTRQQNCTTTEPSGESRAGEYAGGLLGAVWLADELCTVRGAATIATVGDIYNLDDPQSLLDAYGSGSYQWARVITMRAPHAMHVIAAPLNDRWIVVGIAPTSS